VEVLVQHADAAGIHTPTARLMNELGLFMKAKARFIIAEPLDRRALAITEAAYGPHHPHVATCLNNLAGLLRATNRLAEAEPLYRRRRTFFGVSAKRPANSTLTREPC
jgi:hypothetical protein